MIRITPQDVRAAGSGAGAISLAAVRVVSEMLEASKAELPSGTADVERLLTHKHPHLDEYVAMLLFKAALPESQWGLPLEEFVLRSASDDAQAKELWPSSAVFGMGGIHTGGARGLVVFDEHSKPGQNRTANSVTMLVRQRLFGKQEISKPLHQICRETDHIDAYGQAHFKHLGNYIKRLHEAEFLFSGNLAYGGDAEDLLPRWKQALVEGCIAALACAIQEKKRFLSASYWREPAVASLSWYAEHTRLRDDEDFAYAFNRLKRNVCGFKGARLQMHQPDASRTNSAEGRGDPWQLLVMPYLAGLCLEYWGPEIGQRILFPFWEARILGDLGYAKVIRELEQVVAAGDKDNSVASTVGNIAFCKTGWQQPDPDGLLRTPWIIELQPASRLANSRAALTSYLKNNNGGVGYTLVRSSDVGGVVLSKGAATDSGEWERLVTWLVETEGNADADQGGCWHVVTSARGQLADYVLNGNPAHQYAPRTQLTAPSLVQALAQLRG